MARAYKLNQYTINLLAAAIGEYGLTVDEACKAARIHPHTYYKWMRDGRKAKSGIKNNW